MKIIVFGHPKFMGSLSMPRFATMIESYLDSKGLTYEVWRPEPIMHKLRLPSFFKKWLGYIDQYIIFPFLIKKRLAKLNEKVLFVFCDQALGPWVPLVKKYPNVIHCHDLLALKSALGLVSQNPTSLTGKLYQQFIRSGFQKGYHFIPITKNTEKDLIEYGGVDKEKCTVVYNGLNFPFSRMEKTVAYKHLYESNSINLESGFILHVGAGQWYKNTDGVVMIYNRYCKVTENPLPLIMISPEPSEKTKLALKKLPENGSVSFYQNLDVISLQALYSTANLFLFPSYEEGFGWPIVEAQACGCQVVTTNSAPMNEIGGPVTCYIEKRGTLNDAGWVESCAETIKEVLGIANDIKAKNKELAIEWASKFSSDKKLGEYMQIYGHVYHNFYEKAK